MYRSITVLVLFGLLASAMGAHSGEEFEAIKQKCIAETGADPEMLKALVDAGPVDEKMKCFGACILKQFGTLKDDGTVDLDKALTYVPDDAPEREKFVAAVTECAAKKGANDCETAHEIFTCLREKKLADGL